MKQEGLILATHSAGAEGSGLEIAKPRKSFYTRYGKRLFDVLLATILLPLLAPFIIALALVVCCDGGAPFFGHTRVGKSGKSFKCWKLRTMCVDSEQALKEYLNDNPDAQEEWSKNFRLKNDPRVTVFGNVLRSSKLDELPQIFNVLIGELSFVGPRPITSEEIIKYSGAAQIYLADRPGITGLWQIENKSQVSYKDRIQMDVEYRSRVTFIFDLKIIMITPIRVVTKQWVCNRSSQKVE